MVQYLCHHRSTGHPSSAEEEEEEERRSLNLFLLKLNFRIQMIALCRRHAVLYDISAREDDVPSVPRPLCMVYLLLPYRCLNQSPAL